MTTIPRPPTFTSMTPLGQYYIRQAGGWWRRAWHRPRLFRLAIRTARTRYRQFSSRAMEDVQPVLWSGAKSFGREALRTGGNIMTEIAANPGQTGDFPSKHASEATKNISKKLRGGGRKRKKASSHNHKAKRIKIAKRKSSKSKAPPKTIKRDIFS